VATKKKIKKKLKKNINHKTDATTSEAALSSALPLPYFLCFLQFLFCSCATRYLFVGRYQFCLANGKQQVKLAFCQRLERLLIKIQIAFQLT